jgi:hypothetical protein
VFIAGTRLKSRLLVMGGAELNEDDGIADLLEAASDPATSEPVAVQTARPEPVAPPPAVHSDIIPPEYRAVPTQAVTEVAADPIPAPVLASLPLYDRVIPEVYPPATSTSKPALVAVASAGSNQAPKLGAAASTPKRPAVAPPARRPNPLLIAASIAIAVVLAAVAWSQYAPNVENTPVEVAEPIAPIPEFGPTVPEFAASGFGAPDTQGTVLPVISATQAPTTLTTAPSAITASAPDARPAAPQAPPAPPTEEPVVATADTAPVVGGIVPSPAEAERSYAATGVWQRSPRFLDIPSGVITLGFNRPVPDTQPLRVLQPTAAPTATLQDFGFVAPANPPPADAVFVRDADGFIQATPEGTLTPEGAIVFAGLPDLNINLRPTLSQDDLDRMALLAPAPTGVVVVAGRPDFAPPLRPADAQLPSEAEVAETQEPTPPPLGGVGLAALELQNSGAVALDTATVEERAAADLRPQLRPNGLMSADDPNTPDITDILTEIAAEDATLRFDSSTALAVRASQRPAVRPASFSAVVAAAQARQASPPAAAAAPVVAAAPVAPQNYEPVPGGVARAATQEDVIRLRDMNLIGVYGRPNARRALVRLSNGRYVRVEVGSALDGGQVTAIGNEALNYVKRGRTYAIEMPNG